MQIESFLYGLFGLIIGSFLNVCIYRIPRRKSIAFPGSSCPGCGKPIRFYDNIPVLSYLLLRGKCRACGTSISVRYPLVELLTGLVFFVCWQSWGLSSATFVNSLFLAIVITLSFIDSHHQILPNVITLPGLAAGILLSPLQLFSFYSDGVTARIASALSPGNPFAALPWTGSLLGALIGGGSLLLVGVGYLRLRKRQGLGMGDVKMMAMVGAFLGWPLALLTIFAGSVLGTIVGIFMIVLRRSNLQTQLPFGVFLGIASALMLFDGLPFLSWYLGSFRI